MRRVQLDAVRACLRHLHASDTAGLTAAFEEDGLIVSPFLGTMNPRDFFSKLARLRRRV